MPDVLSSSLSSLAWPAALAVAWLAGELGWRWLHLPRISSYGITGFALAASQGGILPNPSDQAIARIADFALALILFELGYRINLRWLRVNAWLTATSIAEAAGSFAVVLWVAQLFAVEFLPALLLATLAMSTSPAAVLRVANDLRSSGQVTERMLHLCAINCVLAVIGFKAVIGYSLLASSGSAFQALWNSAVVVLVSAGLGVLFGVAIPALLHAIRGHDENATLAFALGALLLTASTHALQFSPLLGALAFGIIARHRRLVLSQAQRNFGALGDLLIIFLFVFVAATLDWRQVLSGLDLALAVIAARLIAKSVATTAFARVSGITWHKGLLTGIALTPMSVFAILLLEQSRYLQLGVLDKLTGLAAIVLLLEIFGPLLTHWALVWAKETHRGTER